MKAARLRGIHVAVVGDTNVLAQLTQSLSDDGALVTAHASWGSLARLMQLLVVNVLVVDVASVSAESVDLIRKVRALSADEGGRVPIVALFAGPEADEPQLVAEDVDSIVRQPADRAELARAITAVFAASPARVREAPKRFDRPAHE
jgi:CheY-like chemotaxis protein